MPATHTWASLQKHEARTFLLCIASLQCFVTAKGTDEDSVTNVLQGGQNMEPATLFGWTALIRRGLDLSPKRRVTNQGLSSGHFSHRYFPVTWELRRTHIFWFQYLPLKNFSGLWLQFSILWSKVNNFFLILFYLGNWNVVHARHGSKCL